MLWSGVVADLSDAVDATRTLVADTVGIDVPPFLTLESVTVFTRRSLAPALVVTKGSDWYFIVHTGSDWLLALVASSPLVSGVVCCLSM